MSKIKIFLTLVLIVLIAASYLYYQQWRNEEFIPTRENIITINLEQVGKPIYIKAKNWGIVGNHEEIVLSLSKNNITNKENDYVFYTNEVLYKTDNKNSITIYAPESLISEPKKKLPNITVNIIGLKNADEIKDYSLNYKKYGLQKVIF